MACCPTDRGPHEIWRHELPRGCGVLRPHPVAKNCSSDLVNPGGPGDGHADVLRKRNGLGAGSIIAVILANTVAVVVVSFTVAYCCSRDKSWQDGRRRPQEEGIVMPGRGGCMQTVAATRKRQVAPIGAGWSSSTGRKGWSKFGFNEHNHRNLNANLVLLSSFFSLTQNFENTSFVNHLFCYILLSLFYFSIDFDQL